VSARDSGRCEVNNDLQLTGKDGVVLNVCFRGWTAVENGMVKFT
jgi:hypothetical protein